MVRCWQAEAPVTVTQGRTRATHGRGIQSSVGKGGKHRAARQQEAPGHKSKQQMQQSQVGSQGNTGQHLLQQRDNAVDFL